MKKARKLYSSPNGDRWYLIREASGSVFVRHEANLASGGHVAHIEIGEFLSTGQGPEQQELLRLLGTLVEEHPVESWSSALAARQAPMGRRNAMAVIDVNADERCGEISG
jgi:hypothetical protein